MQGSPDSSNPPARPAPVGNEQAELRLVARVAGGELAAFDALYRIYHPRLARFLDRVTRRPGLVEELLNDTMLVVWNRAERFDGTCKVSTWVFAIAYRKALKALQHWDDAVEDEHAADRVDLEPGPEQQAGRRELRSVLMRALGQLSVPHRAVVDLTYFHGLSYLEISAVVGCPVDTVKTRMFHARRRLRTLLPGRLEDWL
jgi:RNA polymerase sigma factor (sigma-70 family)